MTPAEAVAAGGHEYYPPVWQPYRVEIVKDTVIGQSSQVGTIDSHREDAEPGRRVPFLRCPGTPGKYNSLSVP